MEGVGKWEDGGGGREIRVRGRGGGSRGGEGRVGGVEGGLGVLVGGGIVGGHLVGEREDNYMVDIHWMFVSCWAVQFQFIRS